jgi:hypothetical protein
MTELEFCRRLRRTIEASRRSIAEGAVIDLAGFDREVAALCAATSRLLPADRLAMEAELNALRRELDGLAAALAAQQASAQSGEADAARRRAAQAYGPPPAATE